MVMGVHTAIAALVHGPFHFEFMSPLMGAGARGVQLFFMVSAFTLFLSWKARTSTEATPWSNFYIRRAARILPMWWIACVLYMALKGKPINETAATAFFYFGLAQHALPSVIPGGWSIFAEESFYLFLPVLAATLTTTARAGVFFAFGIAVQKLWWIAAAALQLPANNDAIFYSPFNHLFAFAAGIYLFQIWKDQREEPGSGIQYDALALSSGLIFWTFNSEVLLGSIPLFFVFAAAMKNSPVIGRLARSSALRLAGRYCFSAYLLHFIAVKEIGIILNPQLGGLPAEARLAIYLPLVITISMAVSAATFHVIEKPMIGMGKRIIRRREQKVAVGARSAVR